MPGVVVVKDEPNNYWGQLTQGVIGEALGGLIGGMFDRQKAANDYRLQNRLADDAEARRLQGQRANFSFATDVVDPYLSARPMVDRMDPNVDARTMAFLEAAGMGEGFNANYKNLVPDQAIANVDLGGRTMTMNHDPRTGQTVKSYDDKSLDPNIELENATKQYLADADASARLGVAGIGADANTYAADMRYAGEELAASQDLKPKWGAPLRTSDGRYVQVDQNTGNIRPLDIYAPAVANDENKFAAQEYSAAQRDYRYAMDMGDDVGAQEAQVRMEEIRSRGRTNSNVVPEVAPEVDPIVEMVDAPSNAPSYAAGSGSSAPSSRRRTWTDSAEANKLQGESADFYDWLRTKKGLNDADALEQVRLRQQGPSL